MKKIKVQKLCRETFHKFGTYSMLIDPFTEEAAGPKEAGSVFFRDILQQDLGGKAASYSTCRVLPRRLEITDAEFHNHTCETAIPLDGDAILWFAPASAGRKFPADKAEAFYVPQGCAVVCRPGVWHHAPYAMNQKPVNVLVVLPERTYANDTYSVTLSDEERVELEFFPDSDCL